VLRRAVLLALVAALVPAGASARSLTIRVNGDGLVSRLGALHPLRHPFLRDARAAFGTPTSVRASRGECRARWAPLRLKTLFTSFGGISDFCGEGRLQTAVVRFRLDEKATVTARLRKRGSTRTLKRVTRELDAGNRSVTLRKGLTAGGRYQIVLRVVDDAGNVTTKTVSFTAPRA